MTETDQLIICGSHMIININQQFTRAAKCTLRDKKLSEQKQQTLS